MDQEVGEGEICDGRGVLVAVVIVVISSESLSEAVVVVEHGGDAVKAESVEAVFLQPVFAVGEEEVEHLVLSVVEAEGVPGGMFAAAVAVEIEVIASVEASETLGLVLDGVGVDNIHDDGNSEPVGLVDELLQLLWSAEA